MAVRPPWLILELLLLTTHASAKISHATCQVQCSPNDPKCEGFLPSLPLRSGLQILTTALITGLLAAWQSCGSGQGGVFRGMGRTILQAFIPEVALFQLRRLGYAMDPEFADWVQPLRRQHRATNYEPTKSQIVAVHLRSLAVRADWGQMDDTPTMTQLRSPHTQQVSEATSSTKYADPPPTDAAGLLKWVNQSTGWKDVSFHEKVRPGYRLVTLPEAIFLPHMFHNLPKGRRTLLGTPIYQPAMALLVIQALYFIVVTCVRTSQHLYTTSLEWFFIPTSITLIFIFLANILWEPAWKDIAHLQLSLGPSPLPPSQYPWHRGDNSKFWIGGVITLLVIPVGPITTLVAFITEQGHRPKVTDIVLVIGAILWAGGFLILGVMTLAGKYHPFGGRNPWLRDVEGEAEGAGEAIGTKKEWMYESWFITILIVARLLVLTSALYEMAYLPSAAYAQMSWAQYFPHI